MSDDSTRFGGTIPADYDRLEPFMFAGHAEVFAQRVASIRPARILEFAIPIPASASITTMIAIFTTTGMPPIRIDLGQMA
jgi:hypothetical protein